MDLRVDLKIGIIGLGFVGNAIHSSFIKKNTVQCIVYDKYKNGGIGHFEDLLQCDIIFMALPTQYNDTTQEYDKNSIYESCTKLENMGYINSIVIKSTVEPNTTDQLQQKYGTMNFYHNPEFLTARTAEDDFHNQQHIVIGKSTNASYEKFIELYKFYNHYYPTAQISMCSSTESECMKLYCNSFYAVKIQFMTELYELTNKLNCNFENIKEMMLKNGWINPMHTQIPGPDGQISYGGLCFPKDTNALNEFMKKHDSPNLVIDNTIKERNEMRHDNENMLNTPICATDDGTIRYISHTPNCATDNGTCLDIPSVTFDAAE